MHIWSEYLFDTKYWTLLLDPQLSLNWQLKGFLFWPNNGLVDLMFWVAHR